jgi:hypothetical protein
MLRTRWLSLLLIPLAVALMGAADITRALQAEAITHE